MRVDMATVRSLQPHMIDKQCMTERGCIRTPKAVANDMLLLHGMAANATTPLSRCYRMLELEGVFEEEGHLNMWASLEVLQSKEEQLRAAQLELLQDRQALKQATDALLHCQNDLQVAQSTHIRIKEELLKTRQECHGHSSELQCLRGTLKEWETEASEVRDALVCKREELASLRRDLSERNEALVKAASDIALQEKHLARAANQKSAYSKELIQFCELLEAEKESLLIDRDTQVKHGILQEAEADLEHRVVGWLVALNEIQALEMEEEGGLEKDLSKAKTLLAQVRVELETSQEELGFFRERQNTELLQQKAVLEEYKARIVEAEEELLKKKTELNAVKFSYNELESLIREEKGHAEALQAELKKERITLQACNSLVNSLRREAEEKDCFLSDLQLLLRIKEAELVSEKMVIQKLKSDIALLQLALTDRGIELDLAQNMVRALQKEVVLLRSELKEKEDQLSKTTSLLKRREEQLDVMKTNLESKNVELSEATSVVEQIASFSRALVDLVNDKGNNKVAVSSSEESVLTVTEHERFTINRTMLEKESELHHLKGIPSEDSNLSRGLVDLVNEKGNKVAVSSSKESMLTETEHEQFAVDRVMLEKEPKLQILRGIGSEDSDFSKSLVELVNYEGNKVTVSSGEVCVLTETELGRFTVNRAMLEKEPELQHLRGIYSEDVSFSSDLVELVNSEGNKVPVSSIQESLLTETEHKQFSVSRVMLEKEPDFQHLRGISSEDSDFSRSLVYLVNGKGPKVAVSWSKESVLTETEHERFTVNRVMLEKEPKIHHLRGISSENVNFSKDLVDLVNNKGNKVTVSSNEVSVLTETEHNRFMNRAMLEKESELQHLRGISSEDSVKYEKREDELEALKKSLQCKGIELEEALRSLARKDRELKTLLQRWEVREREISEKLMEKKTLHMLPQSSQVGVNGSPAEADLGKLEFEVVKLDAEAAMTALKGLTDLSLLLVRDALA